MVREVRLLVIFESVNREGRGTGNIVYLDLDYGTWVYTYVKIHQYIYLNCMYFSSYKLSLNNKIRK